MVYTIVIYSSSRVQGESRVERESGVERENRGGIVRGRERAEGGREQGEGESRMVREGGESRIVREGG